MFDLQNATYQHYTVDSATHSHALALCGYAQSDRGVTPPAKLETAPVGKKTPYLIRHPANPAEIDFEPQNSRDSTESLTAKEPPGDNPTPHLSCLQIQR